MSRFFSTNFHFDDKEYVALVAVKETTGRPNFTIRVFDSRLNEIVENEVIVCPDLEDYVEGDLKSQLSPKLTTAIVERVQEHLKKKSNSTY